MGTALAVVFINVAIIIAIVLVTIFVIKILAILFSWIFRLGCLGTIVSIFVIFLIIALVFGEGLEFINEVAEAISSLLRFIKDIIEW